MSRFDRDFALLEAAAAAGKRCPLCAPYGPIQSSKAIPWLCRDGRIRSEISGQNYRVVTILVGPHAGKKTAPNPYGARPWKFADEHGSRRVDGTGRVVTGRAVRVIAPKTRQQPSAPRPLSRESFE